MAKLCVGAIDCSFNNCGWSFLEYDSATGKTSIKVAGIIDNSAKILPKGPVCIDDLLRSHRLYDAICEEPVAYYTATRNKKAFAMEIPGGSQSSRAASCLGMARGILGAIISTVSAQITKHEILLVKPTEVHKKATGSNVATKEQIIDYVTSKYKNQIEVIQIKTSRRTVYRLKTYCGSIDYSKGEFEHIADSLVIAEIGLEKLNKEGGK